MVLIFKFIQLFNCGTINSSKVCFWEDHSKIACLSEVIGLRIVVPLTQQGDREGNEFVLQNNDPKLVRLHRAIGGRIAGLRQGMGQIVRSVQEPAAIR